MYPSTRMLMLATAIVSLLLAFIPGILAEHVVTQISVYYESLCSDSRNFFINQLYPTYEKLNRYMDVELVPFGKANVSYPRHDNKPEFHCHHGPKECYGNRVQSCAIVILKNTELSMKYVHCMFSQKDWIDTATTARRCADTLELEWPKIESCVNGDEGERLLIANSLKTFNLNPEVNYVPWIVIDKIHTKEMQMDAESNLLKYLCDHHFSQEPQIEQCRQENILSLISQMATANAGDASSTMAKVHSLFSLIFLAGIFVPRLLVA